jgi:hypothetical protein
MMRYGQHHQSLLIAATWHASVIIYSTTTLHDIRQRKQIQASERQQRKRQ